MVTVSASISKTHTHFIHTHTRTNTRPHTHALSLYQSCIYIHTIHNQKAKALIGKAELVDLLASKSSLPKKDAEAVLVAFLETVKEEVLVGGKEIRIRDFGTFKTKVSAARVGRNPRTGEELQIAGSKSVAFSVSASLKVKEGAAGGAKAAPAAKAAAPAKKAAAKK